MEDSKKIADFTEDSADQDFDIIAEMDDETLAAISFDLLGDVTPTTDSSSCLIPLETKYSKQFVHVTSDEIDLFLKNQQNKNTEKKTRLDLNTFRQFLLSQGEHRYPELIPPSELNLYLATFLLSVRKKDGTEYEPTSLRTYISSVDRYLKQHDYGYSVQNDIQFTKAGDVLKLKQKQLKSIGKGNKPFAAEELSDADFRKFYEKRILGPYTPTSLINSLFTICTNHFGMRPGKEIHDLTWGDIELKHDDSENLDYLVFSQERQTKTRTGANPRDIRRIKPRAYATPEFSEKDPVALYKLYSQKRPADTKQENSPFFLAINTSADLENPESSWYKRNAMGINKLYGLVKQMKVSGGIENDKRLTNHSMRKHLVQKLSDAGVPANQIAQISGHKNINSINNYSKINNEQNKFHKF